MSTSTGTEADGAVPPPELPQNLIPGIPNDVALIIIARVPRAHFLSLSQVSRSFRSLLKSPIFYATRTIIRSPEPCLYLCIRISGGAQNHFQWFTLCSQPRNRWRNHVLAPLPATPSTLVGSAFSAYSTKIYVIGGSISDVPTALVWALDCRTRMWSAVPSMQLPREFPAAGVIDGKIYVIGGSAVDTRSQSKHWAEVFDPATQKWDTLKSPIEDEFPLRPKWMHASAVIGAGGTARIYAMADRHGFVYEPGNGKWRMAEKWLNLGWRERACVVHDVLYCYDYWGKMQGFDFEAGGGRGMWKKVRGLRRLTRYLVGATMANVGGKLMLVWEGMVIGNGMEIWCAEIEVEKRGGELWGNAIWFDVVCKVPPGSSVVHCLDMTL